MNAEQARNLYVETNLGDALEDFYNAIAKVAPNALSGNFFWVAANYDYAILHKVTEELESQGYRVAYSDGEIRSTKIFHISWE